MNGTTELSQRKIARIAGVLYLVIFFAGIFAQFIVRDSLIIPGDAAVTAANIMESEGLFRMGIAADFVMIIADITIALMFYLLLKPANQALALLAAFFRLAQAIALGINLLNLYFVVELLGDANYLGSLNTEQSESLALFFANAHAMGYRFALIFFAVSIFILGYLMVKSRSIPSILGFGLVLAAIGYLIDGFAGFLLPNYADYEEVLSMVVFTPAVIAELAVAVWLLVKGERRNTTNQSITQAEPMGV